jgi:hypothetical protein
MPIYGRAMYGRAMYGRAMYGRAMYGRAMAISKAPDPTRAVHNHATEPRVHLGE